MTILSTDEAAPLQDNQLVAGANVIYVPPATASQGAAAIQQYLTAHGESLTGLVVTTGGTNEVSADFNQAVATLTSDPVLQLAGSNAVTGAQMLVAAANTYASGGLTAVANSLGTLASEDGGTGIASDPWLGTGITSTAYGGTVGPSLLNTSTGIPPGYTQVFNTSGGGSGSGASSATKWYAIPIPVLQDSWVK